jgi:hypothetical protein
MKRFFSAIFLFVALPLSAAPMQRVARVIDSRTIALENGTTVTLRGVDIPPADEAVAAEYLRSLLGHNWVLVENGDVYRSPDALYVNGQLITHVYRNPPHMTYLGESMPDGPRRMMPAVPAKRAPSRGAPPPRRAHRSTKKGFVSKR